MSVPVVPWIPAFAGMTESQSLRRAEGVGRVSRASATGGVCPRNDCPTHHTERPHPALRATLPALRAAEGEVPSSGMTIVEWTRSPIRHSGESQNPSLGTTRQLTSSPVVPWIPAFAGMTMSLGLNDE